MLDLLCACNDRNGVTIVHVGGDSLDPRGGGLCRMVGLGMLAKRIGALKLAGNCTLAKS